MSTNKRSLFWLITGLIGGALIMLLLSSLRFDSQDKNARCPLCDTEFTIPEKLRTMDQVFFKMYKCPKCEESTSAYGLFQEKDKKR